MNKFVRTESHTGIKFSKIFFKHLYTGWIVVVHLYCGFSLWRQMAPQQSAKFRTAFFGQFRTSLRKYNVANYVWIWTVFSTFCCGTWCTLQRTKHFVVPSVGGATRFANLRRKFSKTQKKSAADLCQILRMVTVEIVINCKERTGGSAAYTFFVNCTRVMGVRVTISCRYALSLRGRCFCF